MISGASRVSSHKITQLFTGGLFFFLFFGSLVFLAEELPFKILSGCFFGTPLNSELVSGEPRTHEVPYGFTCLNIHISKYPHGFLAHRA